MRQPPMEKQPHQGISAYGREPPMNVHVSSAPPMVAQVFRQSLQHVMKLTVQSTAIYVCKVNQ
jgi:hypothetical protein